MTHLTKQDRCKIENFLNAGLSLRKIGKSLHKSHTTISREIKKHRIVDETSKRYRKNFCTFKNNCMKRTLCKAPPSTCKNRCSICSYFSCNNLCSSFIEDYCQTTIIFSLQRQLKIPIEAAKKKHIFRPPFQLKFSEFSFS